jgi:protein-S-isoprenylcysteine O-methyltransferase Ste14
MKHYLPNKSIELLTIPFYILAMITFYILDERLMNLVFKKISPELFHSWLSIFEILAGILFLVFSVILYTYVNFFEKSFPSCLATKNNQKLEGIYNYIRHPSSYIFLFITFGSALCLQSWTIFIFAIINHICIYIYHCIEEYQLCKINPRYGEYLKKTKRFLPTLKIK